MTDNAAMEKYLLSPALDIFKIVITDLDTEGRYLFLNAIADQLRYPHIFLFLWSSVSVVCGNRSGENSSPVSLTTRYILYLSCRRIYCLNV
jgi:CCR4-NOT transcription complex subunit 1